MNAGERAPEGFADRIRRETQEALNDLVSRIAALRSDAEQVATVARAIQEDIPLEVAQLLGLADDVPGDHAGSVERRREHEQLEQVPGPKIPRTVAEQKAASRPQKPPVQQPRTAGEHERLPSGETPVSRTSEAVAPVAPEPTARTAGQPADQASKVPERTYVRDDGGVRRMPSHPGVEGLPEELRRFPAAKAGGPLPQRIEAARTQQRIANALEEGAFTAPELAKRFGMISATVARHLRELAGAGLASYAGEQRGNAPVYAKGTGEPVPERLTGALARMPVETGDTDVQFANKYVIAVEQLKVLRMATQHRNLVIAELDEAGARKGLPRTRIRDHLESFAEQGELLRRTGKFRRAKGQTAGRTAVEYAVTPAGKELVRETPLSGPTTARPPVAGRADTVVAPASSAEAPSVEQNRADREEMGTAAARALAMVRDYMVTTPKEGELVMPSKVAQATGLPVDLTLACLEKLAQQGIIKDMGVPGAPAFAYTKPKDEGAAARLDRQRARERAAAESREGRNGGTHRGDPVPGTGRPFRTGNQRSQEIVDAVQAQGGSARRDGNDHAIIRLNGQERRIALTPGGSGTAARQKAREIGVRI